MKYKCNIVMSGTQVSHVTDVVQLFVECWCQ